MCTKRRLWHYGNRDKEGDQDLHVCLNERQARKDASEREAIIEALKKKLKDNPKSLVGNKGFRKYLMMDRESVTLDEQKIEEEKRFDGKWVLRTNTSLSAEQAARKRVIFLSILSRKPSFLSRSSV